MFSNPKPPQHVVNAYHQLQTTLGGKFHRQIELNPRVYKPLIYSVDRVNDPKHLTRVMLLGPGNLIVHYHERMTEEFEIIELFDEPYGHLFYPGHHRSKLEQSVGRVFTFKPFEPHGLALLKGYLLVKVEVHGKFNAIDIKWAH